MSEHDNNKAFSVEQRLVDNLERDKDRLERKRDRSEGKILSLSVVNERLKGRVKRLEDDVQSLRSTKEYQENGILILTVLCGLSPLFFLHLLSKIIFYCLIVGIFCFILYVKYCRSFFGKKSV